MYKQNEARATKSNFWNNLRVKNNYSYADLASALDLAPSTVAMWFCGKVMPNAKHIQSLCELFGVDCNVGTQEFTNACNTWKSTRPAKQPKNEVKLVPMVASDPLTSLSDSPKNPEVIEYSSITDVFESLYGIVTYAEYEHFRALLLDGNDALETIYGKVPYETYIAIYNKLNH